MGLINEGVLLSRRELGACRLPMTSGEIDRFVDALGRVRESPG